MGPRTCFFNKLPDDAHAAVSGTTVLEPLFYWLWFLRIWGVLIFSVFTYSLVNVRSDFSLQGKCLCNTRKGKNIGGHLGRKSTESGVVTFRSPGGFVMLAGQG